MREGEKEEREDDTKKSVFVSTLCMATDVLIVRSFKKS